MQDYITETLGNLQSVATLNKRITFLLKVAPSGAKDFSFLNDTPRIIKILKGYSNIGTQWTNAQHVLMAMKAAPHLISAASKKSYDAYLKPLKEARDAKDKLNNKSEKQIERFLDHADLVTRVDALISDLFKEYKLPYAPLSYYTTKRLGDKLGKFAKALQDRVILAAYIYQPPLRNDYGNMKFTLKKKNLSDSTNWMYLRGNTSIMTMNVYKNARSMGKVEIVVRPKFASLLKIWKSVLRALLKKAPEHVLYYSILPSEIRHLDDENLRRNIGRISDRLLGKPLSIDDYRHIYEEMLQRDPSYARMNKLEREQLHKDLLHGANAAIGYNLKD